MNYQQVMSYLDNTKVLGSVLGLDTMRSLLAALGDPQRGLPTVHIAGTNGKGSTAAYLAGMLQAAGYQTGLYISPFIQRFGERVQVNGTVISEEEVAMLMTKVIKAAEAIVRRGSQPPTIFELITAMGFLHFLEHRCEIAVIEVGLGGRLDATNIIEMPEAAVITHIGLDHTELLGSTISQIAAEKGGIIKPGCDVILYQQTEEAMETIQSICRARNAVLHAADATTAVLRGFTVDGLTFDWQEFRELRTAMTGLHQISNAVTAVKTAQVLRQKGWRIGDEAIRTGLRNARCIGRLELLSREPMVLVDGAHNPQGVQALMESLAALFPGKKLTFVMGMLANKDYRTAADIVVPMAKRFFTVTPPVPRALPAEVLAETIMAAGGTQVQACGSYEEALELAVGQAEPDDIVCIFGSLYQIGTVRAWFGIARDQNWHE